MPSSGPPKPSLGGEGVTYLCAGCRRGGIIYYTDLRRFNTCLLVCNREAGEVEVAPPGDANV